MNKWVWIWCVKKPHKNYDPQKPEWIDWELLKFNFDTFEQCDTDNWVLLHSKLVSAEDINKIGFNLNSYLFQENEISYKYMLMNEHLHQYK